MTHSASEIIYGISAASGAVLIVYEISSFASGAVLKVQESPYCETPFIPSPNAAIDNKNDKITNFFIKINSILYFITIINCNIKFIILSSNIIIPCY